MWFPLESKKPGKKKSIVTGAVQLQFTILDPSDPTASEEEIMQKFHTLISISNSNLVDDEVGQEAEDDEGEQLEAGADQDGTVADQDGTVDASDKRKKRRLRIARLKNKVKERGYAFTNGSPVAGVLFVEIQRITDLPPERNGENPSEYIQDIY